MSNTEQLRAAATDALRIFDWLARRSIYGDTDMAAVHAALREALAESTHPADVSKSGAQIDMAASGEPADLLACEIQPRPLSYPLADYHRAGSEGPLHYTWTDKPHRLLYDLIAAVRYYATPHPAPARVPLTDALAAAHTANAPLGFTGREKSAWSIGYEEGAANAPAQVAPDKRPSRADLIAALTFYAEGRHRITVDPMTWDTVSGEPPNWEANEAGDMVEDGTVAKRTLAGELTAEDLADDDDSITAKEAP